MAAEEAVPYSRSPSRAPHAVQDTLTIEQRSLFGSRKSQQKTARDKLVWFSPVHSPLLSPGREKTLQIAKRKVRSSSIFSIQSRAKEPIEAEEPTSPKVSCIGQVRPHKKDKDPFADTSKKKIPQSKHGSMSPARFFASPGRASKWGSLFGSRKDSCATPSSSGYGGGEVSYFGSPFDSRSTIQSDRTCAFLAKSLVLLQECGDMDELSNDKVTQLYTHVSDYQAERQNTWAAVDGYLDEYTHGEVDPNVFGEARASAGANHNIPQKKGASVYEKPYVMHAHEKPYVMHGHEKPYGSSSHVEHAGPESSLQEQRHHGKPPASKQRLTYEELPSLHCGASTKQSMKISVEVVPETWLCRNGERLRSDSTSHLNFLPERSTSTSREDLQRPQEEEAITPASPARIAQPYIREAEECSNYQILPAQTQNIHSKTNIKEDKAGYTSVDAGRFPADDTTCKHIAVDNEEKSDRQDSCTDGSCHSHHVLVPSCTHMGAHEEESREPRSSDGQDGASGGKHQAHVLLHGEKLKGEVDGEKRQFLLGSSEVKSGHRMVRRFGLEGGKQNHGLALPQLVEKKLPSVHSNEDGKRLWGIFKGRKSEPFSSQAFSALILVGYDQPIASKDTGHQVTNDEELLKGILEVGRLSFHGTGKYFQVLKGDAEFIRSRSATSHRTVIRLQRCNSDPCRPSC